MPCARLDCAVPYPIYTVSCPNYACAGFFRVVLVMCHASKARLTPLDEKIIFLHWDLGEEICMLQPEGFEHKEK